MILRRVLEHVKDQNWAAIVLDFVIVVAGVFIGFQLSNWNAERLARNEADDLLQRMITEVEEARVDMADYRTIHADILDMALGLSVRLQEVEECRAMDDEMKQLILAVGDFPPPRFSLATASEAIETGALSVIGYADVRNEARRIIDEMTFVDRQWERYVRIKQDAERALYSAAGLSLREEEALDVRPGIEWAGIDQYAMLTPEGVCGNSEMIAFASNAALTQHIYTVYIGEVAGKLDRYAALLSTHAGGDSAPDKGATDHAESQQ